MRGPLAWSTAVRPLRRQGRTHGEPTSVGSQLCMWWCRSTTPTEPYGRAEPCLSQPSLRAAVRPCHGRWPTHGPTGRRAVRAPSGAQLRARARESPRLPLIQGLLTSGQSLQPHAHHSARAVTSGHRRDLHICMRESTFTTLSHGEGSALTTAFAETDGFQQRSCMVQATLITAGQRHTGKIMEESSSKHLTAIAVKADG